MTSPTSAAAAEANLARSAFAGLDLCRAIGLTVPPGARRPNFDQDVWDFNPVTDLAAYLARPHKRWNLATIRNPRFRTVAKEYLVALMVPTHEAVRALPSAFRVARTVPACVNKHYELIRWLNWLADHGVTELGQVTDDLCASYLAERQAGHDADGAIVQLRNAVNQAAQVIGGLAHYRDLFSTDRYPAGFRPFGGKAAAAVAGLKAPGENSTPVVPTAVLQPLLAAALYVVDTLGAHVVTLTRHLKTERDRVNRLPQPRSPDMGRLLAAINRRVAEGRPFNHVPPRIGPITKYAAGESDPLWGVSLRDVAAEAGFGHFRSEWLPRLRPALEQAVAQVGIAEPIGRDAPPVARADGRGETPWTLPLPERHARSLADITRTACLLVIAAATGMRSSELFELARGCRLPPEQPAPGLVRYRLAGKVIKHRGHGGQTDQWVVVGKVDRAVALAEQLLEEDAEPGTLLFGRTVFNNTYTTFRNWVNGPAGQRLGLAPIPKAPVELRMLRRTLAMELAYRPSGLLLEQLDNYQQGIRPSGPHAKELLAFFDAVDGKLTDEQRAAPKIILNDQELRRMLAKRAETLHLGVANYCWFTDPAKALCLRLAGTPTADRPLIGMCDSARCPQATHHPCHRPVWEQAVASTTVFLGNLGRGQQTERARLEAQLARAQRVLADLDAASTPTGTEGEAS